MADITRLGEIAMPKLSDNMAPEDRRSINNYLMQLRDQMMYMMQNLDETNFSDTLSARNASDDAVACSSPEGGALLREMRRRKETVRRWQEENGGST